MSCDICKKISIKIEDINEISRKTISEYENIFQHYDLKGDINKDIKLKIIREYIIKREVANNALEFLGIKRG